MAKKSRKRGAAPSARQQPVPAWAWILTGLVTGLFIAFLVQLAGIRPSEKAPQKHTQAHEEPAEKTRTGPRFDFYAVLPHMEVIIPKMSQPDKTTGEQQQPATQETSNPQPRKPRIFMLQAGSFRNATDADRHRATLILEGFDVRVQPVELDSGEQWHRVMVGPFGSENAVHRAQDQLASQGIEALPIRIKPSDNDTAEH